MKKLAMLGLGVMASATVFAQGLPKPSPAAELTQTMGVTEVSMKYSRPGMKGRTIWGDLVPYGQVWRTGANASTKITFSTDVTINGKEVKAGEYALFMTPTADAWTFVISSYTDGWGVDGYTPSSNVAEVKVTPVSGPHVENMLFTTDAVTDSTMKITLAWGKLSGGFMISANTYALSAEVVKDMVKKADNSFRTYNDAAKWYLDNGDAAMAVQMATKSVDQNKKFWNLTVLSECLAAAGETKDAIKVAKEALEMSKAADYQPYVKRNEANIATWSGK